MIVSELSELCGAIYSLVFRKGSIVLKKVVYVKLKLLLCQSA